MSVSTLCAGLLAGWLVGTDVAGGGACVGDGADVAVSGDGRGVAVARVIGVGVPAIEGSFVVVALGDSPGAALATVDVAIAEEPSAAGRLAD